MVGGTLSVLLTVKEQDEVLFLMSLAVKTTVVVPAPVSIVFPAGAWVKVGTKQLSVLLTGL